MIVEHPSLKSDQEKAKLIRTINSQLGFRLDQDGGSSINEQMTESLDVFFENSIPPNKDWEVHVALVICNISNKRNDNDRRARGFTNVGSRVAYLDFERGFESPTTGAHEIGHALGLHHPWDCRSPEHPDYNKYKKLYDKLVKELDEMLKNGEITKEDYDKRLKAKYDLLNEAAMKDYNKHRTKESKRSIMEYGDKRDRVDPGVMPFLPGPMPEKH